MGPSDGLTLPVTDARARADSDTVTDSMIIRAGARRPGPTLSQAETETGRARLTDVTVTVTGRLG